MRHFSPPAPLQSIRDIKDDVPLAHAGMRDRTPKIVCVERE